MAQMATAEKSKSVQMNVRIEQDLKQQGDSVFARLGYTPTQAVRGLYRFATNSTPDEIRSVIDAGAGYGAATRQNQIAALHRLWEELDARTQSFCTPDGRVSSDVKKSVKELLEDAAVERYEEKGIL